MNTKLDSELKPCKCNLCGATDNLTVEQFASWVTSHNCDPLNHVNETVTISAETYDKLFKACSEARYWMTMNAGCTDSANRIREQLNDALSFDFDETVSWTNFDDGNSKSSD